MSKLRVSSFSVSMDGFGAGPAQSLENPLGRRRRGPAQLGVSDADAPAHGVRQGRGNERSRRRLRGERVRQRRRLDPRPQHVRADARAWPDEEWKGWWGANPPYHVPVFVLTHHPRAPLEMEGGTTFHFVTDGIHAALARARAAAQGRDVRVGGGVAVIRQYLEAGLVDEIHLALTPAVLGAGEALLAGIDLRRLGFEPTRHVGTASAMHVVLTKAARPGG